MVFPLLSLLASLTFHEVYWRRINVNTMHELVTIIQRLCLASFVFLVFSSNNIADCLIPNPNAVPTVPAESHRTIFSETRDMNHDRSNQDSYFTSTHHQWTGILLLSLLSQQDEVQPPSASDHSLSSSSLTTTNSEAKINAIEKTLEHDKIERIVDANTIQLKKKGVVKLAGVRMPSASNFQFPTCFTYSPSYKIRQLLPKKTNVLIQTVGAANDKIPQVVLVRSEDSLIINQELVKTGFAVVKNGFKQQQTSSQALIDAESLTALQETARSKGMGIFSQCTPENPDNKVDSFVADFEPLERSMETVYFSDGGKQMLRDDSTKVVYTKENPPRNPGDTKGCSDFESYEDALQWYETYQSYYGDVAKLDRDGDGVPCPGLPHTTIREKYRMKVPSASVGIK